MEKSLLYATHRALKDLLFSKNIWNLYAYVPGGNMHIKPVWKVKTQKHTDTRKSYFSYDCLRYVDLTTGKAKPIHFQFGWCKTERISGLGINAVNLDYEYALERDVVEIICKLSDDGHDIVANNEVVLPKNKGSELLIKIDMDAPSYSWMDERVPF